MLSGGRDSTCLLDVAVQISGVRAVAALHVNYGLREAPTTMSATAVTLRRLGVELTIERPEPDGRGRKRAGLGSGAAL